MKILTKEEEDAHYVFAILLAQWKSRGKHANGHRATLKGGIGGSIAGVAVGLLGVYGATLRYPAFRSLTLPLKAFLVTSAGTFSGEETFLWSERDCAGRWDGSCAIREVTRE